MTTGPVKKVKPHAACMSPVHPVKRLRNAHLPARAIHVQSTKRSQINGLTKGTKENCSVWNRYVYTKPFNTYYALQENDLSSCALYRAHGDKIVRCVLLVAHGDQLSCRVPDIKHTTTIIMCGAHAKPVRREGSHY